MPLTRSSSAGLWLLVTLAATTTTTTNIETEAWTTRPATTTRGLHRQGVPLTNDGRAPIRPPTVLFGKKKKKKGGSGGGDGGGGSATKGSAKIQVKLLQHIAGTGQAGDVILVNPVFFANKLRPQKLARVITDEEVEADLEARQTKSDELKAQAKAVRDVIDESSCDGDASDQPYQLVFEDNQTGPDGKKLFGGIGPKKLMESLRKDSSEFDAFSKQFTKQVSILDVEEEELVPVDDGDASSSSSSSGEGKYKDYSSYSKNNGNDDGDGDPGAVVAKYTSLPKKDKLTIKTTGVFRMKVALTKDLFAKVRVVVK